MLPAVAARGSGSPSSRSSAGSCCCLSFTSQRSPAAWLSCTSSQNHCVFAPKITLAVFAPACSLRASPSRLPQLILPPCRTILAGLPAHLSVYFPVFSPRFTPCHVFKYNPCAGGLFPLPPSPTSHHSPCLASPAERLWRYVRYFGIFDKGKCNKHLDYLLPSIINCQYKAPPIRKHLSLC